MPEIKDRTSDSRRKFDLRAFLAKAGAGRKIVAYEAAEAVYTQGDTADSVFYINKGRVSISVTSKRGKEAIVGLLGHGEFFGEGCLAGQPKRMSTAKAMTACSVTRIEKAASIRVLHDEPAF